MEGSRTRGGSWGAAIVLVILLLAVVAAAPSVAVAAAPAPPPDACLTLGSFNIAGSECDAYDPERGNQFGPINGIRIMEVPRGVPITLSAPNGQLIDFEPDPDQVCGERGCPRNAVSWRRGPALGIGIGFVEGCGATDLTCTVVYSPRLIGDAGEVYQVVYAEQYLGITPTGNSVMYALYTPPTIYPVRLDPVDSSGARVVLPPDFVAYALAPGADPVQADCVDAFWYVAHETAAEVPSPACVTLRWDGFLDGSDNWFGGWLPNDSGTWTVVGAPRGDAGAPLLTRPSPYRTTTVTPQDDDIHGTIVAERRPGLSLSVVPATTEMALGSTQTVEVTVAAEGGEVGRLDGVAFADAGVLRLEDGVGGSTPDAVLRIEEVTEVPPADGFTLDVGGSRTFLVDVTAVGLGDAGIRAAVSGTDDLGTRLAVDQGGPIVVTEDGSGATGSRAPQPPVVTFATDAGAGAGDPVEGTVEGEPGSLVVVDLVAAPRAPAGECLRVMTGDGVTPIGALEVTLDEAGTGAFALTADLEAGRDVYGTTTAGPIVSAVGECTAVEAAAGPQDGGVDLRGTWRFEYPDGGGGDVRMEITRHDQGSGKVAGTATGAGMTLKVAGTLKRDRLTLTFSGADGYRTTGAGRVVVRDGKATVNLRYRDSGGGTVRLVQVKPKGG